MAVPATRGINGLITHPIKSPRDLERLPVKPGTLELAVNQGLRG